MLPRTAPVIAALATVTALAVVAPAPAGAVVVPLWPDAGRVPTCQPTTVTDSPTGPTFHYSDTSVPSVAGVSLNGAAYVAVPPAGKQVDVVLRVRDTCSGVGKAWPGVLHAGGWAAQTSTQTSVDSFDASFHDPLGVLRPSDAQWITVDEVLVEPRYAAWDLTDSFTLTGIPTRSATDTIVTGPWALTRMWVLRATTLTSGVSSSHVAKGRNVRVSGILRYATDTGYVVDNGEKVLAQTRAGRGLWKTRATLTANAKGVVAWSFKPTTTTSVRLVHVATHTGRLTAPVTSPARVVKVP